MSNTPASTNDATRFDADRSVRSDAFGRTNFASGLASALCRLPGEDGIVVGIEGPWGSGKTHLLNQVQDALRRHNPKPVIVEFNPWLVADAESLIVALLNQLAVRIAAQSQGEADLDVSVLKEQASRGIDISRKILGYISSLQHVGAPLSLLVDPSGLTAGAIGATRVATDHVGRALNDLQLQNKLEKADVFARKREIEGLLRNFDRPVVVLVDDLDRLQDQEIRAMFQAIKAMADFPGIAYLLAYDPERIDKAFNDTQFREKIVQVAYPMPHIHGWDMAEFAGAELRRILLPLGVDKNALNDELFGEALNLVVKLSRQPRDVIRLCNRLRISVPMIGNDVNIADVIIFEGLNQRFPLVAQAIRDNPVDFTGRASFRSKPLDVADWTRYLEAEDTSLPYWEKHLSGNEASRTLAHEACLFLFGPGPRHANHAANSRGKRLADPDLLARFLALREIDGVPSPSKIESWCKTPESLRNFLTLSGEDVLANLGWIQRYPPRLSDPKGIFFALSDYANSLAATVPVSLPSQKILGTVSRLLEQTLRTAAVGCRGDLLLHVASYAPLGVAGDLVSHAAYDQQVSPRRPEPLPSNQQLVPDIASVKAAIAAWRQRVDNAVNDGSIIHDPDLPDTLHRWVYVLDLPSRHTLAWAHAKTISSTPEGFRALFSRMSNHHDEPFQREDWRFAWNIEDVAGRIRSFDLTVDFSQFLDSIQTEEFRNQHNELLQIQESHLASSNNKSP